METRKGEVNMGKSYKMKHGEMQTFGKSSSPAKEYHDSEGKAPKGTGHGQKSPPASMGKTVKDLGFYTDSKISGGSGMSEGKLDRQGPCTLAEMTGK